MITEKQMKSAVKKYNDIMEILGYEFATIGTSLSEGTENWNLRDMVAECDYTLSTYYEDGHCNCEMRFSDDEEDRKMWVSHVGMLKRFIKHWEPYINDMKCAEGHCSRYDNHKDHKQKKSEQNEEAGYILVREEKMDGRVVAIEVSAPKHLMSLRMPKKKRELTDEERKAMADRMRMARNHGND